VPACLTVIKFTLSAENCFNWLAKYQGASQPESSYKQSYGHHIAKMVHWDSTKICPILQDMK